MHRRLGPLQLEEVREVDPDGRIVVHHRLVDTLGRMLKSGTIDRPMHDAGRDFQAAFIVANLDPLRASQMLQVPGGGRESRPERPTAGCAPPGACGAAGAGRHLQPGRLLGVARAGLPAQSIREWAMRQGWGGRPLHVQQAQGIALAALDLLARHFGYRGRQRSLKGLTT